MDSDLNADLLAELGDHLTPQVTDAHLSLAAIREFAVLSCAQLLMRKKKLPISVLEEELMQQDDGQFENEEEEDPPLNAIDH